MESHLEVNRKKNLVEIPAGQRYPAIIRFGAKVISYVFHPVFIPLFLGWFLLRADSYPFAWMTDFQRIMLMGTFAMSYLVLPLVSVLLLKALGFIGSIHLRTQRDRIIPYVVCMVYYWWIWYVFVNRPEIPRECVILSLAIFIASIGGLLANIRIKISMHAIAAGIMASFVTLVGLSQDINFGIYISVAVLLAGMIGTVRLIDGDHSAREVYSGLLVGILSVLIGISFA